MKTKIETYIDAIKMLFKTSVVLALTSIILVISLIITVCNNVKLKKLNNELTNTIDELTYSDMHINNEDIKDDNVVATPDEEPEESPATQKSIKYVTVDMLNVRQGPSTKYTIIDVLGINDEVVIIEEVGDWYYIECENIVGYVCGTYVSDTRANTEAMDRCPDDELWLLAHLIAGEAQFCDDMEQRYVGSVVLNRMKHKSYPSEMKNVIFQKGQYACTWTNDLFFREPTQSNWDNARWLLENGSILPDNVIYQAQFIQGSGVYVQTQYHYYCYE